MRVLRLVWGKVGWLMALLLLIARCIFRERVYDYVGKFMNLPDKVGESALSEGAALGLVGKAVTGTRGVGFSFSTAASPLGRPPLERSLVTLDAGGPSGGGGELTSHRREVSLLELGGPRPTGAEADAGSDVSGSLRGNSTCRSLGEKALGRVSIDLGGGPELLEVDADDGGAYGSSLFERSLKRARLSPGASLGRAGGPGGTSAAVGACIVVGGGWGWNNDAEGVGGRVDLGQFLSKSSSNLSALLTDAVWEGGTSGVDERGVFDCDCWTLYCVPSPNSITPPR